MKHLSLILALAACLTQMPNLMADHHEAEEPQKTPLEEQMSAMKKVWRPLGRQISDSSKNRSSLEYVAVIKQAAQKAVTMTPILADQKSGEERTEFMAGYQQSMKDLISMVEDLEAALKSNDNAKAEEILESIKDARSKGHKEYQPEDY